MVKAITATLALVLIGGCAGSDATISEDFGNAVRQNIALQTINPQGVEADESAMMEGEMSERAIQTYREGPAEVEDESMVQDVGSGG